MQYTFSAIERIKNTTYPGMHGGIYTSTQAWYLTSIKDNNDIVNVEYDSSDFTYTLSKLQTMTYTLPGQNQLKYGPYEEHPEACTGCGSCPIVYFNMIPNVNDQIYTTTQSTFGSKRIKRISGNRDQSQITFEYDPQQNEVFKLRNIKKYDNQNHIIDNVNFTYTLTANNRLFLTSIVNTVRNLNHVFDYYNQENLPARFSFSRDMWGYYNAKNNTTYIPNIPNAVISYTGADQNVNAAVGYYGLLKTIKYPTGGTSTLVYENHSSPNQLLGGYRIKSITDTSESGTPIIKNYSYDDLVQTREPYFYENRKMASTCEGSRTQETIFQNYKAITSSNIHQLMSLNPNIFYGKVVEEITGKGKITHIFETNTDYWGNNIKGDPILPSQWTNFGWDNGKEKSTLYEDTNGIQLKKVVYNYVENQANKTEVRAIARRKIFTPVVYNSTWNGFENLDMVLYKNISRFTYLQSQTTTDYLNGKALVTTTNYFYDNPNHFQLTKEETTFPDGTLNTKVLNYAHEKNNQKLIDANMVGVPLETITLKNGKALAKAETIYPDQNNFPTAQAGTLLLPLSVKSTRVNTISTAVLPSGETKDTEVTFDKYDSKGNILQYTLKSAIPVTIIWGYNQTHPIAKIEGATYAQILSVLGITDISQADMVSKSNLDTDVASEQTFIAALDAFRTNSNLSAYQITTYSYDPLIGVTSITPPSGIREYYHYDTANRLDRVTDVNGNILKENTYHYKP
jgi:hypothetical protein